MLTHTAMLLLISQEEGHGYALIRRLRDEIGIDHTSDGTGGIYRILRKMSAQNLVETCWTTPTTGPAARVYAITPEGTKKLEELIGDLQKEMVISRRVLNSYRSDQNG